MVHSRLEVGKPLPELLGADQLVMGSKEVIKTFKITLKYIGGTDTKIIVESTN